MKRELNTTGDGELACAYGTPWLAHFPPPLGTGKGCKACDKKWKKLLNDFYERNREVQKPKKPKKPKASERLERLHLSTQNTVAMLDRRAEAIAQTLGEENPMRLDLLATKDLLLQLSREL